MAALTANRDTPELASSFAMGHAFLATNSTQYYRGGIVCISGSTGRLVKGATATGLIAVGRCEEDVLTDGATTKKVKARSGIFRFGNSAAADEIAADDIGKDCYIVDDQTVALTHDTNTRSLAGKVYDVDATGVWVAMRFPL